MFYVNPFMMDCLQENISLLKRVFVLGQVILEWYLPGCSLTFIINVEC